MKENAREGVVNFYLVVGTFHALVHRREVLIATLALMWLCGPKTNLDDRVWAQRSRRYTAVAEWHVCDVHVCFPGQSCRVGA
jgi:hypothetical protein